MGNTAKTVSITLRVVHEGKASYQRTLRLSLRSLARYFVVSQPCDNICVLSLLPEIANMCMRAGTTLAAVGCWRSAAQGKEGYKVFLDSDLTDAECATLSEFLVPMLEKQISVILLARYEALGVLIAKHAESVHALTEATANFGVGEATLSKPQNHVLGFLYADAWNRNAVVEQALRNLELQFHVRNLHRDSKQFQPPNLFDALSKAVSTSHSNVDAIVRRLLSSKLVAQV